MTSLPDQPLAAFGETGAMLLRTLAGGRLSPSYLFDGDDEDALREAAAAFAGAVLTGSPPAPFDAAAHARVTGGHHPDLHRLTKDKATVISVAALAPVLARAYATPLESRHQVFVIDPAEAMEAAGIARYLKALEEPPSGTVFVLVSAHAERLPDTVLSRCRRVRFSGLADDVVAARLQDEGAAAAAAHAAARYAGGSLGRARRMLDADVAAWVATVGAPAARGVADAAARLLADVERCAADRAAADERSGDTKRQHVRELLMDLLRALCVEARECAAGRSSDLLGHAGPARALDLVETWGRLAAAVAANVTPAVVLIEAIAALHRPPLAREPRAAVR